jgi:hypothetical protein
VSAHLQKEDVVGNKHGTSTVSKSLHIKMRCNFSSLKEGFMFVKMEYRNNYSYTMLEFYFALAFLERSLTTCIKNLGYLYVCFNPLIELLETFNEEIFQSWVWWRVPAIPAY